MPCIAQFRSNRHFIRGMFSQNGETSSENTNSMQNNWTALGSGLGCKPSLEGCKTNSENAKSYDPVDLFSVSHQLMTSVGRGCLGMLRLLLGVYARAM